MRFNINVFFIMTCNFKNFGNISDSACINLLELYGGDQKSRNRFAVYKEKKRLNKNYVGFVTLSVY